MITMCHDGSIIGTSSGIGAYSLFKTDMNGNILWHKGISTGGQVSNYSPHRICMLSDSSLALLLYADSFDNDFVVIKCDLSGNVIWSNVYSAPAVNSSNIDMVPYSHGGVMVTSYTYTVFIKASGSVGNSFTHSGNRSIIQAAPKSSVSFTIWGAQPIPAQNFFLFDIDSAGNISNYFSYTLPNDIPYGAFIHPNYFISKSPSGGTYCLSTLEGFSSTKFVVFYFDALNQPIWIKRISLLPSLEPRTISASKDNGCIISASYYNGSNIFPIVIRFDSTGTLNWIKTPADDSDPNWYNYNVLTILPDSNSGWYYTLSKPNTYLAHTDSVFNGFCHYENLQPAITTLTATANPESSSSFPFATVDSSFNVITMAFSLYRYDACTGILIDSSTTVTETTGLNNLILIYPNPAQDKVTIKLPEKMRMGIITIYDLMGEKLIEDFFKESDEKEINLNNISSGIYCIEVNTEKANYTRKLVISKN